MRTPKIVSLMMMTSLITAAAACGGSSPTEEDEPRSESASAFTATTTMTVTTPTATPTRSNEDIVVAQVRTPANTLVSIVKGADDELATEIIGTIGRTDADLESARTAVGGDPIAFFERLSGAPAPAALKQAVTQASRDGSFALVSDAGETQGSGGNSGGGTGGLVSPSNPMAVSSGFCDIVNDAAYGSGKFEYCWPNNYSEPWVKRKADHQSCRFDVVDGPIRVRSRYKTSSGWHTSIDIVLENGQYMQTNGHYKWAQRWRECKTVDNSGNRQHHFRVVGHDYLGTLSNPLNVYFPWP